MFGNAVMMTVEVHIDLLSSVARSPRKQLTQNSNASALTMQSSPQRKAGRLTGT
jgi:hypothetical protein